MDSGGAGSPFADSHRTTGGSADPPVGSVQNDGGDSPPLFWTPCWLPARVHRRHARRWTPGEGGSPLPASHPTTGESADLGIGRVQNGGGHSPPSFCTLRGPVRAVHRLPARRWTNGRACPSPRISAPGAEGGVARRTNTVQNRGEDSSPLFCTVCKLVGRSIAVEALLSCRFSASTA